MKTGIELIAEERSRQISVEGWTPEHDDGHSMHEMSLAAICYIGYVPNTYATGYRPPDWPWENEWWKPSTDPIPNLVKAGALIAAEIDRLHRIK